MIGAVRAMTVPMPTSATASLAPTTSAGSALGPFGPAVGQVFAEAAAHGLADLVEIDSDAAQSISILFVSLLRRLVVGARSFLCVVVSLGMELLDHFPGRGQGQALFAEQAEQRAPGVAQHAQDEVVVSELPVTEVAGLLRGECQQHLVVAVDSLKHLSRLLLARSRGPHGVNVSGARPGG